MKTAAAPPLPRELLARLRINDVLARAATLDFARATPAVRYLKNCAPGLDWTRLATDAVFREHPYLNHWASRAGSMPALILPARRAEDAAISALHCIFLTAAGDLAPLVAPRLLLGALDGSLVVLQRGTGRTYLCESFEMALACIRWGARGRVAYALRRENMVRAELSPGADCVCVFDGHRGIDAKAGAICDALQVRGIRAVAATSQNFLSEFIGAPCRDG